MPLYKQRSWESLRSTDSTSNLLQNSTQRRAPHDQQAQDAQRAGYLRYNGPNPHGYSGAAGTGQPFASRAPDATPPKGSRTEAFKKVPAVARFTDLLGKGRERLDEHNARKAEEAERRRRTIVENAYETARMLHNLRQLEKDCQTSLNYWSGPSEPASRR